MKNTTKNKKNEVKNDIPETMENSAVVSAPELKETPKAPETPSAPEIPETPENEEVNTFDTAVIKLKNVLTNIKVDGFKTIDGLKNEEVDKLFIEEIEELILKDFDEIVAPPSCASLLGAPITKGVSAESLELVKLYDLYIVINESMNNSSNTWKELQNVPKAHADAVESFRKSVLNIAKSKLPKKTHIEKVFRSSAKLLKAKQYDLFNDNMELLTGFRFSDEIIDLFRKNMFKGFSSKLEIKLNGYKQLERNVVGACKIIVKKFNPLYEEQILSVAWKDVQRAVPIIDEETFSNLKETINVLSIADKAGIKYDEKNIDYQALKKEVAKNVDKLYAVKPSCIK